MFIYLLYIIIVIIRTRSNVSLYVIQGISMFTPVLKLNILCEIWGYKCIFSF